MRDSGTSLVGLSAHGDKVSTETIKKEFGGLEEAKGSTALKKKTVSK